MTDIFISYAREDRAQAAELAQLLEENGYIVWWDWNLVGGDPFRAVIGKKLKDAKKVIVLWSDHSINSSFVIDEAQEAKDEAKLLPIVIDNSRPPLGFRDLHTLYIRQFYEIRDVILAAIEDSRPLYNIIAQRRSRRILLYAVIVIVTSIVTALAILRFNARTGENIDPVYTVYGSSIMGVTIVFPHNILSLDTTERKQMKLSLRDGYGNQLVTISRTPLPKS